MKKYLSMAKTILYFDPLVSSTYFCNRIVNKEIDLIAILHPEHTCGITNRFDKRLFKKVVSLTGDVKKDLILINHACGGRKTDDFIIGYEGQLAYAELLAHKLFPETANDLNTSKLRFDKFEMNEALRHNGLNAIKQILINRNTSQTIVNNFLADCDFPIIVKPNQGSGASVGVTICHDIGSVFTAINNNFNLERVFETSNKIEDILLQEYIVGEEYFVDSYSLNGKHKIASIYRYAKKQKNNRKYCTYCEIVCPSDKTFLVCANYAKTVLDCLGMKKGFAHTEIMLRHGKPYLIELNPRLSGSYGAVNKLARQMTDIDQVELFLQTLKTDTTPLTHNSNQILKKQARLFFLHSQGQPYTAVNEEKIRAIDGYNSHYIVNPQRNTAHEALSLLDIVAFIAIATDKNIDGITQQLYQLESSGELLVSA